MSKQNLLNFDDLNLKFSQVIQIIPEGGGGANNCFDCVLVGCLSGEAVIVTVPQTNLFPKVAEGDHVVIRVYTAQGVALFPTTVLYISEVPTFLVYLDFPNAITFKKVRESIRVEMTLPTLVSNVNRDLQGIVGRIVDISVSGAQIELFEYAGEKGDSLIVKGKFSIDDIHRKLSIDAVIMDTRTLENGHQSVGVRFEKGNEENTLILLGIVYSAALAGNEKFIS